MKLATAALLTLATAGTAQNLKRTALFDPILEQNALYLNVPNDWTAEGVMVPGSSCEPNPIPVYRASSADSLTGVYLLPRIDWSWPGPQQQDCSMWRERLSARDLLNHMVAILNVGFIQEEPEAGRDGYLQSLAQMNSKTSPGMVFQGDMARFLVRYELNGHPVEEWLSAQVQCVDRRIMGPNTVTHTCSAWIRRFRAPLGKLHGLGEMFHNLQKSEQFDQQWNQRWNALMANRIRNQYSAQTQALLAMGNRAQEQRTKSHQDFMAVQERGRDMRNYRFKEGQYAKQHASDDRVDFLLDCQRGRGFTIGNCPARQTRP